LIFVFFYVLFFLFSCASRVPLTRQLIKEYNLSYNDIKLLQLYISDDIILEQESKSINKDIDKSYSLKKIEQQYLKRIYFKAQTPCIAVECSPDKLVVAFEPLDNLVFVYNNLDSQEGFYYKPDKKENEWNNKNNQNLFDNYKIIGQQKYGDSVYNVIIKNKMPLILVDESNLKNFLVESRTVPGMRLKELDKIK
jgi:hypothetical protein